MVRERESEKFQPHMVASFNKHQLVRVFLWSEKNVPESSSSFTQDFLKAVETAESDEKGKKMDEKARNRLNYAIKVIGTIANEGYDISQIQGIVTVWQLTPDGDKVGVRWNIIGPSKNSGQRRY